MRHKNGYPWAMRSIGRSVRSVRSVCKIKYSCYSWDSCSKKTRGQKISWSKNPWDQWDPCAYIKKIRVPNRFVLFVRFVFKKTCGQKISWSKNPWEWDTCAYIKKIRVPNRFVLFELFVFKKTRGQKISWSKDLVVKRVRSMCNDYSCSKNTIKNK